MTRCLTSSWFQLATLTALSLIATTVFSPGIMTPDSTTQYSQAVTGQYSDWHPPLMSILLSLLLALGGNLTIFVFVQCLALLTGIRLLVARIICECGSSRISYNLGKLLGTIVATMLLAPITPLLFFAVSISKDSFTALMLIWICVFCAWLFKTSKSGQESHLIVHCLLLAFFSSLSFLVRHNSLVILPVVGLYLVFITRGKIYKFRWGFAAAPLLSALIISFIVSTSFDVKRTYVGDVVKEGDLATMIELYPELADNYPVTAHHRDSPIILGTKSQTYVWDEQTSGAPCVSFGCEQKSDVMHCEIWNSSYAGEQPPNCLKEIGSSNAALNQEYFRAIRESPQQFILTKAFLFLRMFHPRSWDLDKFKCEVYENPFGLKFDSRFDNVRSEVCRAGGGVYNRWYTQWISGIHAIWFLGGLFILIGSLFKYWKTRSRETILIIILVLIPISYYFSYLIGTTGAFYRYFYPATLVVQIIVCTQLISTTLWIINRIKPKE